MFLNGNLIFFSRENAIFTLALFWIDLVLPEAIAHLKVKFFYFFLKENIRAQTTGRVGPVGSGKGLVGSGKEKRSPIWPTDLKKH